jgi:hypothetical protein
MCQNAAATAASLLKAEEPSLKALLSYLDQTNTPAGIGVVTAFDAAVTSLQNWKSGTPAQNVLQLIGDFVTGFDALAASLPLPPNVVLLVDVISAGVQAAIGIVTANSPIPTPAPASANASSDESVAAYQAQVASETEAKVAALVPNFHRSIWHSAAHQYKNVWNNAVTSGGFPPAMKI